MESVNSLRISAPPWWPLREGRDGKCEGRNEKCKFLARESVSSSPIVRIFGKGKCKFIANFSATMVTSLPSLSLSLCISLSLSLSLCLTKVPHAQYRKRFRASYNIFIESNFSGSVGLSKFVLNFLNFHCQVTNGEKWICLMLCLQTVASWLFRSVGPHQCSAESVPSWTREFMPSLDALHLWDKCESTIYVCKCHSCV